MTTLSETQINIIRKAWSDAARQAAADAKRGKGSWYYRKASQHSLKYAAKHDKLGKLGDTKAHQIAAHLHRLTAAAYDEADHKRASRYNWASDEASKLLGVRVKFNLDRVK